MRRIFAFAFVGFALTACSDSAGPLAPDGSGGTAQILVGRASGVSASVVSSLAGGAPPVEFSQVASLELVINRVEAHRVSGGGWIALNLEPTSIDLAGLSEGSVQAIASGGLPEGTYNNVRFFLESATVSFLSDVSVGGTVFTAGELYDLDIPSVENTGIKIPTAHFTVDGSPEAVVVLFDPAGSTASIGTTGNGKVRMSPVFHEADEATEAAEEEAAEEETEEASEESGSGSASLYISPVAGASASRAAVAGGLALSMLPPGQGPSASDVTSLRLVLCEVRAVRTGGDETDEAAETEAEPTSDGTVAEEETSAGEDEVGCQGRAAGAGWTTLPLESVEIDLFGMAEGEVVEVAGGELPAGRYRNFRLYYSEAWVTFAVDVTVGNDTYVAGTEIALRIPGAENTGIKIPASHFEVGADATETMVLLFDQSSASSLKVTGNAVQMSPIFREASQAVEDEVAEEAETGSL